MEEIEVKQVVFSAQYALDTEDIYNYGTLTFGQLQAQRYESLIDAITSELATCYLMYPECRWIPTKSRVYRNIVLDSHLVIYRITPERVEVLRVISSRISISAIRKTRSIKPE